MGEEGGSGWAGFRWGGAGWPSKKTITKEEGYPLGMRYGMRPPSILGNWLRRITPIRSSNCFFHIVSIMADRTFRKYSPNQQFCSRLIGHRKRPTNHRNVLWSINTDHIILFPERELLFPPITNPPWTIVIVHNILLIPAYIVSLSLSSVAFSPHHVRPGR